MELYDDPENMLPMVQELKPGSRLSAYESQNVGVAFDVLVKAGEPLSKHEWLNAYREVDKSPQAVANFIFATSMLMQAELVNSSRVTDLGEKVKYLYEPVL